MSADATIARTIADYLRERLALVRWFRMNASVKHGVPLDEPAQPSPAEPQRVTNNYYYQQLQESPPLSASPGESPQPLSRPVAAAASSQASDGSWLKRAAPWVIGAATLGGGGTAGYALSHWLAEDQPSVSVPAPSVEGRLPCESPLQWLEDRGENRP